MYFDKSKGVKEEGSKVNVVSGLSRLNEIDSDLVTVGFLG